MFGLLFYLNTRSKFVGDRLQEETSSATVEIAVLCQEEDLNLEIDF